ncbi:MAG: PLP-dependent aminotransferase family protein [Acidobacteria bacterium]|nr:PLP-dependent aminotransferase family protein [Acidobacteriota bacterium]
MTTPLPTMIRLDRASGTALRTQLYLQLRDAILSGRLPSGTRLPSTRDLAEELDVSRNTALDAFTQLTSEGYLEGHVGDGTYVSRELPDDLLRSSVVAHARTEELAKPTEGEARTLMPVGVADYRGKPRPFRTSTPALDAFPYATWSRLMTRRWKLSARELLTYGDPAGYAPLREATAAYLGATRGVRCTPEQLILTNGSQHALAIAASVLLDRGNEVWMEDPGFLGARAVFSAAGASLVPVPVDDDGLDVDAGIERAPHARLAYVTPSHQYPLGPTLSLRRRLALLQWAARSGAWIVEDDYDSEFRYSGRPLPALQGIDAADRVIYVGTFSKVLFPSIRTGYIVAPPQLVPALLAARALSGHPAPALDHAVLCDFIAGGHFARHIHKMRVVYAQRQRALVSAAARELAGLIELAPSEAGMHLIGWLPPGVDDQLATNAALANGVEVTPLSAYCLEPRSRGALRLGYTGYGAKQLWEGARRLAVALR